MNDNIRDIESKLDNILEDYAKSLNDTIKILSLLIELSEKDYETSHSRFVSNYSFRLAKELGLDEIKQFEIKSAALLHDIGKVYLPTNLSKYFGEMTREEYKNYQKHVELAYQILNHHKGLSGIAEIILQHHELLDGTGFPRKLQASQIDIGAQIIAPINYYHNYMYKNNKNSSYDKSISIIEEKNFVETNSDKFNLICKKMKDMKNIKFNSEIVNLFINMLEEDRKNISGKLVRKLSINNIKVGMYFAENIIYSNGLLFASKGEKVNNEMLKALNRSNDNNQFPEKLLMITVE